MFEQLALPTLYNVILYARNARGQRTMLAAALAPARWGSTGMCAWVYEYI